MTEGELLGVYKKHKAYLEMQINRYEYLLKKIPISAEFKYKREECENALVNLKSLFGEQA
jgi:hypothetical protein